MYFLSKGHLTPNGDFNDEITRDLTFKITNAAAQWHKFNDGNWAAVEHGIKDYVQRIKHDVYVFTGTGKFITSRRVSLNSMCPL